MICVLRKFTPEETANSVSVYGG